MHNPSSTAVEAQVRCAKCGRSNNASLRYCTNCGGKLYISCKQCRHRNVRASNHCEKCGTRLHHSLFRKLSRRLNARNRFKITPLELVLLVLAVYFTYKVIVRIAEMEPPEPE